MKTGRLTFRETRKQEIRKQENVFGKQKQKTETIQKTKLKAMKTTNNVQKTENRNFEKSTSKFFAVVASLVLISFTVSANGFWKQIFTNNSFGKMAIAMVDQENEDLIALIPAEETSYSSESHVGSSNIYTEEVQDKGLGIEIWMTNNQNFSASVFNVGSYADEPLKMEDWMISNSGFLAERVSSENDPALKLESWMTNDMIWRK